MRAAGKVERFRVTSGVLASDPEMGMNGAFVVPCGSVLLKIIASDGAGWDHVSVSLPDRCPTWDEMCYIRRLFFRGDETVVQFHPPIERNINYHPYCLHMWRPQGGTIIMPPSWMVGPDAVRSPEEVEESPAAGDHQGGGPADRAEGDGEAEETDAERSAAREGWASESLTPES